ncbi:hypothetical protein MNEG_1632, partial [Monoraphidium neglectum]
RRPAAARLWVWAPRFGPPSTRGRCSRSRRRRPPQTSRHTTRRWPSPGCPTRAKTISPSCWPMQPGSATLASTSFWSRRD